METTKLTLRPSKRIVDLAHRLAEEENTSITQMFSAFILARHNQKVQDKIPIGPLTRSVTGILKVPDNWDYKKEMEDILEEKYGLRS
ncbi:MAG: hypothetical protein J6X55_10685 [Victivallales bacterium]|nr:hypothetical protein [Victivallales bacterium]